MGFPKNLIQTKYGIRNQMDSNVMGNCEASLMFFSNVLFRIFIISIEFCYTHYLCENFVPGIPLKYSFHNFAHNCESFTGMKKRNEKQKTPHQRKQKLTFLRSGRY